MNKKNYSTIVVLSGKGGTGKTSLTASFAGILKNKIVVDCDVDAANLHLLLKPIGNTRKDFISGYKAQLDTTLCSRCRRCQNACRFEAISNFNINQIKCEGCALCSGICPSGAIKMIANKAGMIYRGIIEDGSPFYHARLLPGQGNSGKLVAAIKKAAEEEAGENTKWMLVDGPPGIGCPVNASLAGADYIVLVAEPTLSGLSDLSRMIKLLRMFRFRFGIIINKSDINKEIGGLIKQLASENDSSVLGEIAFNTDFVRSLQQGMTIVEFNPDYRMVISEIWGNIEVHASKQINSITV